MGSGASTQSALDKAEWISKIPCFRSLDEEHMISLSAKVVKLEYKKGESIITEGQVGSLFGILVSGSVQSKWVAEGSSNPWLLAHPNTHPPSFRKGPE